MYLISWLTLFLDYAARYLSSGVSVTLTLELPLPRLYNRAPVWKGVGADGGEASVDFPRPSTYPVADDEWIRFRGCWISNAIPATTIYPVFSRLRYHHTVESTFPPPIIAAAMLVAPRCFSIRAEIRTLHDIFRCPLLYSGGVPVWRFTSGFPCALIIVSGIVGRDKFTEVYTRIFSYPIDSWKAYTSHSRLSYNIGFS